MSTSTATITYPRPREGVSLEASAELCRRIARRHGRNFYYGMMLTPGAKRAAMYAVYAWMRAVDDLADGAPGGAGGVRAAGGARGAGGSPDTSDGEGDGEGQVPRAAGAGYRAAVRNRRVLSLETFRRHTAQALDPHAPLPPSAEGIDPRLWPAVRDALLRYEVPGEYLFDMIDGQMLDQRCRRYESFEQLYDYCYKVAGTVGLVCITIWGYQGGAHTRALAEKRGVALQLTNVLRDLVEDARRDRVYLPADELADFGYDPETFRAAMLSGEADERFDRLMAYQLERARGYYDASAALEDAIEPGCRPTCWAMMRIYRRLLEKIAARPRRVLNQRVTLGCFQKLTIAVRASWQRGVSR